jgi:hypothetical protein
VNWDRREMERWESYRPSLVFVMVETAMASLSVKR